jgi:hypothetical protein
MLQINRYSFLKKHYPVDLCNSEVLCSLWDMEWILKYYLDELQRVNEDITTAAVLQTFKTVVLPSQICVGMILHTFQGHCAVTHEHKATNIMHTDPGDESWLTENYAG